MIFGSISCENKSTVMAKCKLNSEILPNNPITVCYRQEKRPS